MDFSPADAYDIDVKKLCFAVPITSASSFSALIKYYRLPWGMSLSLRVIRRFDIARTNFSRAVVFFSSLQNLDVSATFSPFAEWEAKMTVHWLRWVGGREQGLLEHRDEIEVGTYYFFCLMGRGLGVTSEPENYALAVFSRCFFLSSQIHFWSKFYVANCISVWGSPWRLTLFHRNVHCML